MERFPNGTARALQDPGQATEDIPAETAAIRTVALQSRLVLGFLPAEEGGSGATIGRECCTYTPDSSENVTGLAAHIQRKADSVIGAHTQLPQTQGELGSLQGGFRHRLGVPRCPGCQNVQQLMGSVVPLRGLHVLVLPLLTAALLKPAPSPQCSLLNECCVPESRIRVKENNTPGLIISNITVKVPPVTLEEQGAVGMVRVVGNTLQLSKSLDYELHPVGQLWITVMAVDLDQDVVYYSLDQNTDGAPFFSLKTENTPELYLTKALDYEKERSLMLLLNAKEAANSRNISDTVTITVNILDEDNLPPVFQPCSELPGSGLCLNAVYQGQITQYQIESRPLRLQPRDILAVDGDTGINATIVYQIVNDYHKAFRINTSDGTLTMSRAVNCSDSVALTVLAAQENDHYKYTTTSVTLSVVPVSQYPPQFVKSVYDGSIRADSPPGSIILQPDSSTKPLTVQAQDGDYPNLTSPVLSYTLTPPDHFTISRDGLIFTRTHLLPVQSQYRLTVTATDEVNGEVALTSVNVLVTGADGGPSSRLLMYEAKHMAAVGVPLSVLLLVCLCIIYILLQQGGWGKLRSVAKLKMFSRRSHSSGDEPVQFTNQGLLADGKAKTPLTSLEPVQESVPIVTATALASVVEPAVGSSVKSTASHRGSPVDEATSDGGVKSILTKERKSADSYKAVWFKEDIEPETDEDRVTEEEEEEEGGTEGGDRLSSSL
ncbi:cadherin-related family member 5-like [Pristis pectinata]|uniref:cadherin-related family member 5-like n=1 Tax=Pristis pectinata TaxID=685728 RepID=UPI00223CA7E4|nr:cadherin-related family member 5-like [Pristis pectinata]